MSSGGRRQKVFESNGIAYNLAVANIPNNVWTQVNFNMKVYDIMDEYDETVAYAFSPRYAGVYQFIGIACYDFLPLNTTMGVRIGFNLVNLATRLKLATGLVNDMVITHMIYRAYPQDTFYLETYQNSGAGTPLNNAFGQSQFVWNRIGSFEA